MLVDEVMTREVITLSADQTISEAVDKMAEKGISGAPVVDDSGQLAGIITENDILNALKTKIASVEPFNVAGIEETMRNLAETLQVSAGKLIHPFQLAWAKRHASKLLEKRLDFILSKGQIFVCEHICPLFYLEALDLERRLFPGKDQEMDVLGTLLNEDLEELKCRGISR